MDEKRYTLEELSQMTGFSEKSLRNFIKSKLLVGEKVDRKWFFTKESLGNFLNESYVRQGLKIKRNSVIYDYLVQPKKEPSICLIYDYPSTMKAATEICKIMTERINSLGADILFKFNYDEKTGMARYIVTGPVKLIQQITDTLF